MKAIKQLLKIVKESKNYTKSAKKLIDKFDLNGKEGCTSENVRKAFPVIKAISEHDGFDESTRFEQTGDKGIWEGKSERPITSKDDAVDFFNIDLKEWEIERYVCNAWDVSMSDKKGGSFKRTNYQTKVWVRSKDKNFDKFKKWKKELDKSKIAKSLKFENPNGKKSTFLILGCVHIPYHNKTLWNKVLGLAKELKIDGVVLAGDFLDLKSLSRYDVEKKMPEKVNLWQEYKEGFEAVCQLNSVLKEDCKKYFIYGNHEERALSEISKLVNQRYGRELRLPHEALDLGDWQVLTNWKDDFVQLGNNLQVFHGTKYGANPCRDYLKLGAGYDMIFFHSHRYGMATNGKNKCYNLGTLGDINGEGFKYADRFVKDGWQNGFGVVNIDERNHAYVTPVECTETGFFFGGKLY